MRLMKLDDLVNNHLRELSQTDLIVWRYISNHRKECCYVSIYDLADACNVLGQRYCALPKSWGWMVLVI